MRNITYIIGIIAVLSGIGLSACKSKKMASNSEVAKTIDSFVDKKWKLLDISGVELSSTNRQLVDETFIMFSAAENRVNGNNGCNNFSGTYKSGQSGSLLLSGMASTRRMCIDMTVENQMNRILGDVDSYSISNNILSLKQAGKTLARFVLSD